MDCFSYLASFVMSSWCYERYHSVRLMVCLTLVIEQLTFSGQTFTGKMSVAVGGGLIGVFLTLIGYIPEAQGLSDAVLNSLFFGICMLPAIGSLLRLGFMSCFTFTEDKHA